MFSAIGAFLAPHKFYLYLGAGLAVAGVIGGLWWAMSAAQSQRDAALKEVGSLGVQLDKAATLANENAQALLDYQRIAKANLDAVIAEHEAQAIIERKVRVIYKTIEEAPPSDDGPLANVLVDAVRLIDQLRGPEDSPSH